MVLEIELVEFFMGFVCRIVGKWYGLGSAGVAKGLDLLATIIKEGKRLSANVYLALELVISYEFTCCLRNLISCTSVFCDFVTVLIMS